MCLKRMTRGIILKLKSFSFKKGLQKISNTDYDGKEGNCLFRVKNYGTATHSKGQILCCRLLALETYTSKLFHLYLTDSIFSVATYYSFIGFHFILFKFFI